MNFNISAISQKKRFLVTLLVASFLSVSTLHAEVKREQVLDIISNNSGHAGGANLDASLKINKDNIYENFELIKHYLPMVFNGIEYELAELRALSDKDGSWQRKKDKQAKVLFGKSRARQTRKSNNPKGPIFDEVAKLTGFDAEGKCFNDRGEEVAASYKSKKDPTKICINLPMLSNEIGVPQRQTLKVLLMLASHEVVHRLNKSEELDELASDIQHSIEKQLSSQEDLIESFQKLINDTRSTEKSLTLAQVSLKNSDLKSACNYLYDASNSAIEISNFYRNQRTDHISPLTAFLKSRHEKMRYEVLAMLFGACGNGNLPVERAAFPEESERIEFVVQLNKCFGQLEFVNIQFLAMMSFIETENLCDLVQQALAKVEKEQGEEVDLSYEMIEEEQAEDPDSIFSITDNFEIPVPKNAKDLSKLVSEKLHFLGFIQEKLLDIYGNRIVIFRTGTIEEAFSDFSNYTYRNEADGIEPTCKFRFEARLQEKLDPFDYNAQVIELIKDGVFSMATEAETIENDRKCDKKFKYYHSYMFDVQTFSGLPTYEFKDLKKALD